eukprot:gnl/TRDRNA2_/TRDRNA2_159846_c1_seq1.p1 gnl/TRDRNA2_/TRDRNA2_159846_c1~~gnl/TRDRNA2_/TRDRNA2_159846_c1_seq1.p1  ORF type:complete len:167 (-),score=8.70 gnl/TRDRNA2_/TRDRNA2_159846_c1_seq1:82-549(-)
MYAGRACIRQDGWSIEEVSKYQFMAVTTGGLAGLVGIGGGLIFSPFFIFMGVDPSFAVATSSTCVMFISSSTFIQYLFTDRVIISLTVLYGTVVLFSSYVGTAVVHYMQDACPGKKWWISGIVALGVCISAVLAVFKLIDPAMPVPVNHHTSWRV